MAGGPNVGGGKRGSAAQTVGVLNLLTDLAFNLLIFFVVCASTEPEKGRSQQFPNASKEKTTEQQSQNVKVSMTRTTVKVNDEELPLNELRAKLEGLLADKTKPEDRIVVVVSEGDTTYAFWIRVTGEIKKAGAEITLQLEEEKEVSVK